MSASYIFDHENSKLREHKLQKLLQKAYEQVIDDNPDRSAIILQEIVEIVLCSRPICRRYNGQPLSGVYLEIYNKVRSKLVESALGKITQSNFSASNCEWLYLMQTQAFQIILDDIKLKKMALAAQNTPKNSGIRSHALRELIKAIKLSRRLIKFRCNGVSSEFEKLIYEEAVMETLSYVCLKIDLYDPERGNKKFMNWVNFKLEKTVIRCRNQFNNPNLIETYSLSDLENIGYKNSQPSTSDLLYQYIQQDSENIFKSVFIQDRPEANFQQIALARISGHTWKEISQYFKLSIPTLSSFFQRNCEKFQDLFKKEFKS